MAAGMQAEGMHIAVHVVNLIVYRLISIGYSLISAIGPGNTFLCTLYIHKSEFSYYYSSYTGELN